MEKIRIDHVTFAYPQSDHPAIEDICLTIQPSEFVVLCGRSGCGKSTLLRHLKTALIPYGTKTGTVYIDGEDVETADPRRSVAEVGFVQQNPDNQVVTDKVWHELAFGLESLGLSTPIIKRRVAEMASYFGIQSWFRKDVAQLSGGQKQLLNLASVMAMQPSLLILDEPSSQLDPIAASEFLHTIYKINRELGTTIVISEHRLEEVFPMADRVVVLEQGRIVAEGDPRQVGSALQSWQAKASEQADASSTCDAAAGGCHPMYYGMPTVMRLFPSLASDEKLPLTVREGRLLAERLLCAVPQGDAEILGHGDASQGEKPKAAATPQAAALAPVLRIQDLWFRYEKRGADILRGLSLDVAPRQIHCLLGGNGSGKSTLLKAMVDIIHPQRGKIRRAEGLSIAMVPQNPQALFTEITVEEELLEGLAYSQATAEEKIQATEQMLATMEIQHLRKANPYDLSGGEQQRLAVGKVMLTQPDILLLDEPTKGLDPFFKRTMGKILQELRDTGVTIFMVSHDIEFCAAYGDCCAMFFDGEVVSQGPSRSFFAGNRYYTTTTNQILRKWNGELVTCEEGATWLKAKL